MPASPAERAGDESAPAASERDVIRRWFDAPAWRRLATGAAIRVPNGDDCSVLAGPALAMSVDSAVSGRHFPHGAPGGGVATRALGAALSDLAAMGAEPVGFLLALHLPTVDPAWLSAFSDGLLECARRHRAPLLGGDTVRGPLAAVIQVVGRPLHGDGLRRAGAGAGDAIYLGGALGAGAAGLAALDAGVDDAELLRSYWRPEPQLALGAAISDVASAAIDLSDGLAIDLARLAAASGLGAEVALDRVPLSGAAVRRFGRRRTEAWALGGGDDYALCFTVPESRLAELDARLAGWPAARRVGRMTAEPGLRWRRADGSAVELGAVGHDHFGSGA